MATLLLPVGTCPVGIQQIITSGSQFDGARSTTTPTLANGMTKFPTDTKGGLFDFEQSEPIIVHHILADFGVNVTWSIKVVNLDALGSIISGETLIFADGTATAHVSHVTEIILGYRQAIQLITSGGASAKKVGRVWATTCRGFPG